MNCDERLEFLERKVAELEYELGKIKFSAENKESTNPNSRAISKFIEERCITIGDTLSINLYHSFRSWAKNLGVYIISHKAFGTALRDLGIICKHTNKGTLFSNISLSQDTIHCSP